MKSRIIKSKIANKEITNRLLTCDYCGKESNEIKWFIGFGMTQVIYYRCPFCYEETVESKKVYEDRLKSEREI